MVEKLDRLVLLMLRVLPVVLVVEQDGVLRQHQQQVLLLVPLVELMIALLQQQDGEIQVELKLLTVDKVAEAELAVLVILDHHQLAVLADLDLHIQ